MFSSLFYTHYFILTIRRYGEVFVKRNKDGFRATYVDLNVTASCELLPLPIPLSSMYAYKVADVFGSYGRYFG